MDLGGAAEDGAADDPPANSLLIASVAAAGAAVLHAAACGAHSDTAALARIFMVLAIAQAAVAMAGFLRPGKLAVAGLVTVNAAAAAGWLLTRLTGLSDVSGLEVAQQPGVADTAAAILALVAALAALLTWFELAATDPRRGLTSASVVVAALVVPGMLDVTTHDTTHHDTSDAASHAHAGVDPAAHVHTEPGAIAATGVADGATGAPSAPAPEVAAPVDDHHAAAGDTGHGHATPGSVPEAGAPTTSTAATEPEPAWPRPWDPTEAIDFSGVPGVTPDQEARAEQLVADTMRDLPAFADVTSLAPLGYKSIGDSRTGFEHYINFALLGDDKVLDPTAPESLVYQVDDPADPTARTLVSAMFIAQATSLDDPAIADFAGPLMQWHNHTNLCWRTNDAGAFVVAGVTDDNGGTCPEGTVHTGGQFPMVHVWIAPHQCGPFAALEGHGAGQAGQLSEGERVDLCGDHHGGTDDHTAAPAPVPYDPTQPIDLGGVAGVTAEQQAFAENLVADTVRNLPQWADPAVAEAAGFHSILDGSTGHEHYIQWDWINDDVWLDPDFPESLVYEPQLDGTKTLVSAMYMLPNDMPLTDVPDWGGALMQWHEHGDLCFTDDPVAPRVAGTKPIGAPCQPPLVDRGTAPMIHVWITPHPCGPFAALEGIGAGQVAPGDTHLCDQAHGAH
jgi:hypothetical protein